MHGRNDVNCVFLRFRIKLHDNKLSNLLYGWKAFLLGRHSLQKKLKVIPLKSK